MKLLAFMLSRMVTKGRLEIFDHKGNSRSFEGRETGPDVAVRINESLVDFKLAMKQELWFAEAYMNGNLTLEKGTIFDFLSIILDNHKPPSGPATKPPLWKRAARKAIGVTKYLPVKSLVKDDVQNYQKGHAFFGRFLDDGMQFSCAYWPEDVKSLEEAQIAKIRHIAAKLNVAPGNSVLDIGCGWGGMALYLASVIGARVVAISLSPEQLEVARLRAKILGLEDSIEFRLQDYRDVPERFDRVVSVAMLEHVGRKNLGAYFSVVRDKLNPNGVALIHAITSKGPPAKPSAFIQKYFDSEGCAPSLSETFQTIEKTGLWTLDCEIWRLHYAKTVEQWRARFENSREDISAENGEPFTRLWEFYLAICQCAFGFGQLGVFQIQLGHEKDAVPVTRSYIDENTNQLKNDETGKMVAINASLKQAIEELGM